jgi:hypothetical protein
VALDRHLPVGLFSFFIATTAHFAPLTPALSVSHAPAHAAAAPGAALRCLDVSGLGSAAADASVLSTALCACPLLEELDVSGADGVTAAALRALAKTAKVRHLQLLRGLLGVVLALCAHCPHLRSAHCIVCGACSCSVQRLRAGKTGSAAASLRARARAAIRAHGGAQCPALARSIQLTSSCTHVLILCHHVPLYVLLHPMCAFRQLPRLAVLHARGVAGLCDGELALLLAAAPALAELDVSGCAGVTAAALAALAA